VDGHISSPLTGIQSSKPLPKLRSHRRRLTTPLQPSCPWTSLLHVGHVLNACAHATVTQRQHTQTQTHTHDAAQQHAEPYYISSTVQHNTTLSPRVVAPSLRGGGKGSLLLSAARRTSAHLRTSAPACVLLSRFTQVRSHTAPPRCHRSCVCPCQPSSISVLEKRDTAQDARSPLPAHV